MGEEKKSSGIVMTEAADSYNAVNGENFVGREDKTRNLGKIIFQNLGVSSETLYVGQLTSLFLK
jgi:hypothetical protein